MVRGSLRLTRPISQVRRGRRGTFSRRGRVASAAVLSEFRQSLGGGDNGAHFFVRVHQRLEE
jgi:hypothetical protein